MSEIITYSLRGDAQRSGQYYRDIAPFCDEVVSEIRSQAGSIIEEFQTYLQQNQIEDVRGFAEYAFELLMLGVFWQTHLPAALKLPKLPQQVLAHLWRWRKKSAIIKPAIDFLRGILGTIFLTRQRSNEVMLTELSPHNLKRLLAWMAAAGDFPEDLARLQNWGAFLEAASPSEAEQTLKAAVSLGAWFEARSKAVLGIYTPNVEKFIHQENPFYRYREDVIFCSRERVEYHLAMVGTEILNRSLREDFLAAEHKVVLLPPCMKARLNSGCKAVETPLGERCMACEVSCRVHQLTKLGEKHGFAVLVMPHDLDVFGGDNQKASSQGLTGVVGVSCPLTNPAGGWEMKKMGAPAQGVLLDYCGCPWHWHEEGISTDINFDQVLKVLGIR